MLDQLQAVLAFLILLSLASERLVTVLKTALPGLEEAAGSSAVDPVADRPRRLRVQLLALACGYVTVSFVAATEPASSWVATFLPWHQVAVTQTMRIPVAVLAFLSSGGSALWTNLVGYTKAIKEVRRNEKMQGDLMIREQVAGSTRSALALPGAAGSTQRGLQHLRSLRERGTPGLTVRGGAA